mmetsp:Transcript_22387/g.26978  ORF Transcript_22387/g.26978 Transcript_22387/m.26978 type:complete len:328 (+) Transcript_22387:238-1221(+)|eukprot:CAMPEP_0197846916 /NCGR_PEP_ID=MMETSP1438-20131217/4716_1 /TAXON_ID=1461541 /ORGANISM="Pterosperma sp., Strain CCMP1384" /LENGTH=327 /DNA_ID=CAMNT_0043458705 /DNA_START=238 /DNA_END=1221 /DNA_ORIENTATION=+
MASKQGYVAVPAGDTAKTDLNNPVVAQFQVVLAICFYALCSSSMLVVNKLAVHFLPAPAIVLFFQLFSSALAVKLFAVVGWVKADELEWTKVKPFMIVAIAFLGAIFTNMKTLQYANVETFIVFRSSTPILIAILDYMFLGRELPTPRSWASLVGILCGAIAYVMTDSGFEVRAYAWVAAWFIVFAFDQVFIKYVCDTVPMTSWGRVWYTNFLSLFPLVLVGFAFDEHHMIQEFQWTGPSVYALTVSCICGVGMSYSAFWLRSLVSATSFTIVGIMCKIATVVINLLIWDKHASPSGLAALSVCLAGGCVYQQSPMRSKDSNKAAGN